VYAWEGGMLTLPLCTSVGGNVYVGKGGSLVAPMLKGKT
jgi:hypothetical protein